MILPTSMVLQQIPLGDIAFYGMAALAVASSILVVTLDRLFHTAVFLAVAFLSLGMLYLYLGANLVGVIQILIYAGAVTMLLMFVLMLTKSQTDAPTAGIHVGLFGRVPAGFWQKAAVGVLASVILGQILFALVLLHPQWESNPAPGAGVVEIAKALLESFALPFEIASVLLLAALLGAIILARTDDGPVGPIEQRGSQAREAARQPAGSGDREAGSP